MFALYIFLAFTWNLFISLYLKWVSYIKQVAHSYIIYSANLCLVIDVVDHLHLM